MSYEPRLLQPYEVSRAVYRCESTERKMLYYSAMLVQHKPYKPDERPRYLTEFRISAMLYTLGMANTDTNRKRIRKAVNTIAENTLKLFDDEEHLDVLNWLQRGIYDEKKDVVTLIFTDEIGKLFEECKKRFSLINLKTVGGLKSFYAMRFYEIALSYRGYMGKCENDSKTWFFEYSLEEIRTMFKIDESSYSYQKGTNTFITKVVKQPIAELNKNNPDFVIRLEKQVDYLDKRRVTGFKFVCKVCGSTGKRKKVLATDSETKRLSKQIENERIEAENDFKNIEQFKILYPDEFARRLQERRASNPIEMQAISENAVFESMQKDGYSIGGKKLTGNKKDDKPRKRSTKPKAETENKEQAQEQPELF